MFVTDSQGACKTVTFGWNSTKPGGFTSSSNAERTAKSSE